jgi:hypothetical protein
VRARFTSSALEAGLVADNSIRYTGQFGDWYVGVMYSFGSNYEMNGSEGFSGQVPGHFSEGDLAHLLDIMYWTCCTSSDAG